MRQQQDEPGRFSICSRQAAVVHLQAWAYFKDRVREEGMTYKACESWMSTEASALYKSPKQEWSFLDSTSVGENDKSQPD
ncbi:hypothetical protein D9D44_25025 [Escherichia coli]|nr:hypothetical protein [Escherichia coli]